MVTRKVTRVGGGYVITKESGPTPAQFAKFITKSQAKIRPMLKRLAFETSIKFRDTINANRKRKGAYDKDSLANAFKDSDVTVSRKNIGFSVGDVDFLNSEYPYWYVADVGGIIPPSVRGWFGKHNPPMAGHAGQNELFHRHSKEDGGFFMKPKLPTRPLNYLSTVNNWAKPKWHKVWDSYFRVFNLASKRG
jgi:hypothetical protein